MSQENVEIVQRGFQATLDQDWGNVFPTLDSKVEIHDFDVPDAGVYRGHEGFVAWLQRWNEGWDSWRIEDLEFRATGDDEALATFRMIAKGKHSGLEIERDDALLYRVTDGKIVRMEYFNDRELALEAAGLSS